MSETIEFRTRLRRKPDPERRDGETYATTRDRARLSRQATSVLDLMIDGKWRTLREMGEALGEPQASISARLRDLRKERFGAWKVERAYVRDGIWQYRVQRP